MSKEIIDQETIINPEVTNDSGTSDVTPVMDCKL